jgi:XFP-like protein
MFIFDAQLSTAVKSPTTAAAVPAPAVGPLPTELLDRMNRYWQAANYLTTGQIYLQENALLQQPLAMEHTKPSSTKRCLHAATSPCGWAENFRPFSRVSPLKYGLPATAARGINVRRRNSRALVDDGSLGTFRRRTSTTLEARRYTAEVEDK